MKKQDYIDAEFEVIEPANADAGTTTLRDTFDASALWVSCGRWTFWDDDFPNLLGLAAGLAGLFAFRLFFGH